MLSRGHRRIGVCVFGRPFYSAKGLYGGWSGKPAPRWFGRLMLGRIGFLLFAVGPYNRDNADVSFALKESIVAFDAINASANLTFREVAEIRNVAECCPGQPSGAGIRRLRVRP